MKKIKTIIMSGSETGCRYAELLRSLDTVDLILAVTGVDRPCGRGRVIKRADLAEFCDQKGLDSYQTCNVNSEESVDLLRSAGADLAFVVDFGQILSPEVLNLFPLGAYNIHYSILPELRGAAPVRWALIRGYDKTGVTLMRMNERIDEGGMVSSKELSIHSDDNHDILKNRLTDIGLELTENFFMELSRGKIPEPVSQTDARATNAPKIKGSPEIDWDSTAEEICDLIRGMAPSPGCITRHQDKGMKIKILKACISEVEPLNCGSVSSVEKRKFTVSAADKSVEILMLQPAGKRPMSAASFLAGNSLEKGEKFV